jgi:hypothetical protein
MSTPPAKRTYFYINLRVVASIADPVWRSIGETSRDEHYGLMGRQQTSMAKKNAVRADERRDDWMSDGTTVRFGIEPQRLFFRRELSVRRMRFMLARSRRMFTQTCSELAECVDGSA